MWTAWSNFTNSPPELNNTKTKGGYSGYPTSPVCVNGTAINFNAVQCSGIITNCNYRNDVDTDTERIVTNCGFNEFGTATGDPTLARVNGTFGLTNPTFSCYYNKTGTYSVRLYLQDNFNTGDFTKYNTEIITINVIDGIPGTTCDTGEIVESPEDAGVDAEATPEQEAIDDSIESTMGILFGTSSNMKLIVGVAIIIGIIVLIAQATNGAAIPSIAGGLLGVIIVTFLGFFSIWIMLLILITLVLLLLLSKFIIPSGNGGGS